MVGSDLEQAGKRIRNAWIVGFLWAAWSFIGVVTSIWSLAPDAEEGLGLKLFIFAVVEVGLVAFLAYGVLKRRKSAATLLFFYFWTSRIFWISIGLISFATMSDIAKFFVLQVLPAYLFFQGMRGAWTFYYLTHPQYPSSVTGQELGISESVPAEEDYK